MVEAPARLLWSALLLALLGSSAPVTYSYVSYVEASDLSTWISESRYAWCPPALVIAAFSVVPVMLLVSLTGMAFEPVLGPLYAMTGCLLFLCIPLSLAWMINRHLRARSGDVWRG